MTCVVGVVNDDGKIFMGADSAAVDSNFVTAHMMPKVFKLGEFGIGYCHSFRLGQIVQYYFNPPPIEREDIVEYMIKDFIPELRSDLDVNEYPTHDDEKQDWSIMIGVRGHLFVIESDFHLGYDDSSFSAIGAGCEFALGAMHESDSSGEERAMAGLRAAENFCPYVVKPFNFIEV